MIVAQIKIRVFAKDLFEMGDKAVDYHRGEMEIGEQVSTFHAFIGMTKWGSLAIAVSVLFLAMVFCAHAGLFQSAGAALVVLVVGVLLLREKKVPPAH